MTETSTCTLTCLVCTEELTNKPYIQCSKNHVVCQSCQRKMGRSDCLFCNPCVQIDVQNPLELEDTPHNRSSTSTTPSRTEMVRDFCLGLFDFLKRISYGCLSWIACVYLGKVYIAFYFWCNPDQDHEWFGWDKFRYMIGESILGLFVSLILASCCLSDRGR